MVVVSSTPAKVSTRPTPFTPKRALPSSDLSARLARTGTATPALLSTHKKYKAPLSAESKTRTHAKSSSLHVPSATTAGGVTSPGRPRTPTLASTSGSGRPRTPGTPSSPRKGAESPSLLPAASEMDVSNVNPEKVLVDSLTVEPGDGDMSGEVDEAWVRNALLELDQEDASSSSTKGPLIKEDKVMVSIRIRPTQGSSAWLPSSDPTSHNTLTPNPKYYKSPSDSSTSPTPFTFDTIHFDSSTKPLYLSSGRPLVHAAMSGYNSVIFAYGQTASGKTYTLSGDADEPGIIPRAMRDVFRWIRRTPGREYLLRCSYLEIYNECVYDLLAPPESAKKNPVQIVGVGMGGGNEIALTPLREEVVISLNGVKEVLKRGEGNRRTATTDWNERSSRSHSVFRMVIESRERVSGGEEVEEVEDGRRSRSQTPGPGSRRSHTPGPGMMRSQTPGPGHSGPRLQARGGKSVRVSVLSLIDLAGSEKATSDKERTREGRYINTSLLTLGTVIGTLADNAAKRKTDHIPYRNSKLTRLLQPSLAGNARISVVCTLNPDPNALAESLSTLGFARRVGGVKLNAQKKEVEDTDALIERYRKEIEDLKKRLEEREKEVVDATRGGGGGGGVKRRLSVREQMDESKAMQDLNARIQQLTKLILTSQTVDDVKADDNGESRAGSPVKVDFDMSPYQLQQELLSARLQLESQATQILSLEAALEVRPPPSSGSSSSLVSAEDREEGDLAKMVTLIEEQAGRIMELEGLAKVHEESGHHGNGAADATAQDMIAREENLRKDIERKVREEVERSVKDELERKVREDLEKEWKVKIEDETRKREEGERWTKEVVKQLEKEKKMRTTLEEERRALAAFVSKFDSLGLGVTLPSSSSLSSLSSSSSSSTLSGSSSSSSVSKLKLPMPSAGGAAAAFAERRALAQSNTLTNGGGGGGLLFGTNKLPSLVEAESPTRPVLDRVIKLEGVEESSPLRLSVDVRGSLTEIMREEMPEEADGWRDVSFEVMGDVRVGEEEEDDEVMGMLMPVVVTADREGGKISVPVEKAQVKGDSVRAVFGDKENIAPVAIGRN